MHNYPIPPHMIPYSMDPHMMAYRSYHDMNDDSYSTDNMENDNDDTESLPHQGSENIKQNKKQNHRNSHP